MKLIPLSELGQPTEPISDLPKEAIDVGTAYVSLYQSVGYQSPWLGYLALVDGTCVGSCGFKAPPKDNRVEIAYFTFSAFEGKGMATRMAKALLSISSRAAPQVVVAAQTLPKESPSTTILKKLGFKYVATLQHPEDGEVWEWQLTQQDSAIDAAMKRPRG
ncbi:MAG TPA: GNAT family N-acetyltransferase [Candidatus Competibacter sp.]|nr:GNAT family N-acetyltransferase [Candidatus Competibacter sp.]